MAFASDQEALDALRSKQAELSAEFRKVIAGQEEVVVQVLVSVFGGSHFLLIGAPCLAKTLLVHTTVHALVISFNRIHFIPDLMPSDIIGDEILDDQLRPQFNKGPLFANSILPHEINWAQPKTQSALLEAMRGHPVTATGLNHKLPHTFFVLATQSPIEQEGSYPLPYLQRIGPSHSNITLETWHETANGVRTLLTRTNHKHLCGTIRQQHVHHTSNCSKVCAGDFLASGAIFGPSRAKWGCMLELTWNETGSLTLEDGSQRSILKDGNAFKIGRWADDTTAADLNLIRNPTGISRVDQTIRN